MPDGVKDVLTSTWRLPDRASESNSVVTLADKAWFAIAPQAPCLRGSQATVTGSRFGRPATNKVLRSF